MRPVPKRANPTSDEDSSTKKQRPSYDLIVEVSADAQGELTVLIQSVNPFDCPETLEQRPPTSHKIIFFPDTDAQRPTRFSPYGTIEREEEGEFDPAKEPKWGYRNKTYFFHCAYQDLERFCMRPEKAFIKTLRIETPHILCIPLWLINLRPKVLELPHNTCHFVSRNDRQNFEELVRAIPEWTNGPCNKPCYGIPNFDSLLQVVETVCFVNYTAADREFLQHLPTTIKHLELSPCCEFQLQDVAHIEWLQTMQIATPHQVVLSAPKEGAAPLSKLHSLYLATDFGKHPLPDFTVLPALKQLSLAGCKEQASIDPFIALAPKLQQLEELELRKFQMDVSHVKQLLNLLPNLALLAIDSELNHDLSSVCPAENAGILPSKNSPVDFSSHPKLLKLCIGRNYWVPQRISQLEAMEARRAKLNRLPHMAHPFYL